MIDNLKRLREPAGWLLLAIIVGFMVLSVARLAVVLGRGEKPVFSAFDDIASSAMNLTLVALLVVIDCMCLFSPPTTKHAIALTRASAITVTIGTGFTLVATGLGLASSGNVAVVLLEALGGLLDILLKALASAALWIILRAVSSGRLQTRDGGFVAEPAPLPAPEPPSAPDAPPIWQPDAAAGSVWRTAADAASGSAPAGRGEAPFGLATGADGAPSAGAATPAVRAGAAEALGWHRASPDTSSSAHVESDTP